MDNLTVNFTYKTACFSLNYPEAILNMALPNLRKLFQYMASDPFCEANKDAVYKTRNCLNDYSAETKESWGIASRIFQQCYVDTKYLYGKDKKKTDAYNKKLMADVKSAKAKHNRAEKLRAYFEDITSDFI